MWPHLQFHVPIYNSFYGFHFCKFIFVQFILLLLRTMAPTEVITHILGTTAYDAMS